MKLLRIVPALIVTVLAVSPALAQERSGRTEPPASGQVERPNRPDPRERQDRPERRDRTERPGRPERRDPPTRPEPPARR